MAVLVVVLGAATIAFYRYWDDSKGLRRNANDIVLALRAGERWRADVRAATGPIAVAGAKSGEQIRIPTGTGEIIYRLATNELFRQIGSSAPGKVLLANVKSSQMKPESRGPVAAWRWELELQPTQKGSRCVRCSPLKPPPGRE